MSYLEKALHQYRQTLRVYSTEEFAGQREGIFFNIGRVHMEMIAAAGRVTSTNLNEQ